MSSSDEPPTQPAAVDKSDFFFPGAGVSALLIHGLTGTPFEMRYLGERLAASGVRVRGVKLTGHAGSPEELGVTNYDNWYESAVKGFEELRQYGDPNIVVGLSAGAVLGARLAEDQPEAVAGIAMLAPAFFLTPLATIGLKLASWFGDRARAVYLANSAGSDIHDAQALLVHPTMPLFPIAAPMNLLELSALVRKKIAKVKQPALIIHSRRDHTCPMKRNVKFLMKHLGSAEKRAIILDESFHVITVDSDKDRVASEAIEFVNQFRVTSQKVAGAHG
ncbi:MAG TPA: alpha/beta fold hydrolase [Candidatus Binataceae bacterium]